MPSYSNPNTIYNFLFTPVYFSLSDTLICNQDDSIILNSGTPSGGSYFGPGVIGNIFYPGALTDGNYTIGYSLNNISAYQNIII